MKTLTNVKVSADDSGNVTITGKLAEFTPQSPVQRASVGHIHPNNRQWPRHVVVSHEAVFVHGFGAGFAIQLDDVVHIASQLEPRTSYPPKLLENVSGLTANVVSEVPVAYQWQVADKLSRSGRKDTTVWTDISGQTGRTLDASAIKDGQFFRVVLSSAAGTFRSHPSRYNQPKAPAK